jgi:CBS domain-containing protein
MELRTLLSREVLKVGPQHTLTHAARLMHERHIGSAVIHSEDGRPGILTERDLLRAVAEGADPTTSLVGDYMTTDAITATLNWDALTASREMIDGGFRHLIVLNAEGNIEGILSIRDLFRHYLTEGAPPEHAGVH